MLNSITLIAKRKPFGMPLFGWFFLALFFFKALILGLWVLPLWDIPDERGHFSYARDIASGKGIMPLGEAILEKDLSENLRKNHIVQHPPLYYLAAGTVWKFSTFLTTNLEAQYRSPRTVSALFGMLTLYFIYKILTLMGLSERAGLAGMIGFSAIPMFSYMSAGTNHDTMVAFWAVASTYYFVRYFHTGDMKNAYWSVFLMSLGAITKMTVLVILAPLVGVLALEIKRPFQAWVRQAGLLIGLALALPGIWLMRNYLVYGNPFAAAFDILGGLQLVDAPLEISFLGFLQAQPEVEFFFVSFIGSFLWHGVGSAQIYQIRPPYIIMYEILFFLASLFAMVWVLKYIYGRFLVNSEQQNPTSLIVILQDFIKGKIRTFFLFLLGALGVTILISSHHVVSATVATRWVVPPFSILFALWVASMAIFIVPVQRQYRPIFYALLALAFFSLVMFHEIYTISSLDGRLRATHGRYFYPALGMIVLGVVAPSLLFLGRQAEKFALPAAVVVCFTEAAFFFLVLLPMISEAGSV